MTKQEYRKFDAYLIRRIEEAKERRKFWKEQYINTNCPYPVGTKLQIDDYGTRKDVRIQKYTIDENDNLQPVFVALNGKCQFTHKPTIIKEIK